jgi:hypothetical protein
MADGCGTEYCQNYGAFAAAWAAANSAGAAARAGSAMASAGPSGTTAVVGGNGVGITIDSSGQVTPLTAGTAVVNGQTTTVYYKLPGGGTVMTSSGPNSVAAVSTSG